MDSARPSKASKQKVEVIARSGKTKPAQVTASTIHEMRKSGIAAVGDVPWGIHYCQFYQTKEDLLDVLVPYFKAGLENNELCMWVTSEPLKVEDAEASLRKAVRNLDHYVKKGQIEILDYTQWNAKSGRFEPDRVLKGWVEKEAEALKRGFDGLRLTGNTLWLEKKDWRNFTDYEATVNSVIGRHRMIALCSYSLDRTSASEVIDVVNNHRFVLLRRRGNWGLIENAEYKHLEEAYQSLVNYSLQGLVIIQDWRVVFANDAAGGLIRRTADEILAFSSDEVKAMIHPDDQEFVWRRFRDRLEGKTVASRYELRVMDRDGLIHWVEAFPRPIEYRGEPALQVAFVDITERRRAEEEIRRLARFPSENPNPILRLSKDGIVLDANKASEPLLRDWGCDVGGKAPKYWCNMVNELYASQSTRSADVELGHQTFLFTVVPVKDAGYVNLYGRDITKRKQAEEALRESEEKYRAIVENSPNLITIIQEGSLKYVNSAACKRTDWTFDELTSPSFNFVEKAVSKEFRDRVKANIAKRLRGEDIPPYEINLLARDGSEIPVVVYAQKIFFQGKPAEEVILTDITERKRVEQALQHRLEFEETVSKISSSFVGVSDIDSAINTSLADIASLSGASRAYVFQFRENGAIMDNTHEWCAEGVSLQINNLQNLSTDKFPWWMTKLRKGEVIHVEDAQKMPAEARTEQKILLLDQGIKSLLVLPFNIRGELAGFIGFDNVIGTGPWRESDLALLRVCSKIIGDAVERKQMEDSLRRHSEHLEELVEERTENLKAERQRLFSLLENLPVAVYLLAPDHSIQFANRYFRERLGDPSGKTCYEIFGGPKELCRNCPPLEIFKTGKPKKSEFKWPDNRTYELHDYPFTDVDGSQQVLELGIDITERKRMENELRQRTQEIEELNKSITEKLAQKISQIENVSAVRDMLRKAPDVSTGLNLILDTALNDLDMEVGAVLVANPQENTANLRGAKSRIDGFEIDESYPLDAKFVELEALRQTKNVTKIVKEGDLSILKTASVHCTPIHFGKKANGILAFGSQKERILDNSDLAVLGLYTELASTVFETQSLVVMPVKETIHEEAKRKFELEFGNTYLVKNNVEKAFEIFTDNVLSGLEGLCVTREFPEKVKRMYGLKKTPIVWLTEEKVEDQMCVHSLQDLSILIGGFLDKVGHGVVLLDGFEYLITNHGFESFIRFLQLSRSRFEQTDSLLIAPLLENAIDLRQVKLIERETKPLMSDTEIESIT